MNQVFINVDVLIVDHKSRILYWRNGYVLYLCYHLLFLLQTAMVVIFFKYPCIFPDVEKDEVAKKKKGLKMTFFLLFTVITSTRNFSV